MYRVKLKSSLYSSGKIENYSSVYWLKNAAFNKIKKALKQDIEFKKAFLIGSGVPSDPIEGHFVYQLRLRGQINSIYVGLTGLHTHERYLNHIIGYKASSRTKWFATALITFEGPMEYNIAKKREPDLADKFQTAGFNVHGGH